MFKFSAIIMVLASTALSPLASYAQDHAPEAKHEAKHEVKTESVALPQAATPGDSWLLIEESLRNLTDAIKSNEINSVLQYVQDMAQATDALLAANIHNEVKPQEEEHLMASLENLKLAIDGLVEASASGDPEAFNAALTQAAGAITLTRIDVPPGLLEKISGAGVRAEIVNTPVLQKGVSEKITLRLKSAITGKPLKSEDLSTVHTQIVHALVVDPQLADYTHAHPEVSDVPGEYTFTLTPQTDCTYRLWADVTPVKGKQEYAMVDIPAKDGCGTIAIDKTESVTANADGFTVNLKLPEAALTSGGESMLTFEITNAAGEAVSGLEPIMGAYAHVVGFYDDYRTIAHLHPMGDEPKTGEDRGASPLSFHFKPERAGFVKLFMQISVDGKERIFPFGVMVQG